VSFKEQIMSKDKYLTIFLRQMEALVFIILQIFFATCAVLKIGELILGYSPVLAVDVNPWSWREFRREFSCIYFNRS